MLCSVAVVCAGVTVCVLLLVCPTLVPQKQKTSKRALAYICLCIHIYWPNVCSPKSTRAFFYSLIYSFFASKYEFPTLFLHRLVIWFKCMYVFFQSHKRLMCCMCVTSKTNQNKWIKKNEERKTHTALVWFRTQM